MKYYLLCFVVFVFGVDTDGQTVSEALMQYQRTHNLMNQMGCAVLNASMICTHDLDGTDTVYHFEFHSNHQRSRPIAVTLGTAAFDPEDHKRWQLRMQSETPVLNMRRANETVALTYDELSALLDCADRGLQWVKQKAADGHTKNILTSCAEGVVEVGAEYIPQRTVVYCFYLKVGADATFTMNLREFESIMSYLRSVRQVWRQLDSRQSEPVE